MKRFIVSVLCVSVLFIGLGAIVERAGAQLRSDQKALDLMRQARAAIGGEVALAEIRGMVIAGRTANTFNLQGTSRTEEGQIEIALQLPDKMIKSFRIGDANSPSYASVRSHDVVILKKDEVIAGDKTGEFVSEDGKRVIIRKSEGDREEISELVRSGKEGEFVTKEGNRVIVRKADDATMESLGANRMILRGDKGEPVDIGGKERIMLEKRIDPAAGGIRENELFRTVVSLLLAAPEGMDASFTFAGEGDVDGAAVNIVNAEFAGWSVNLHLSKASSLPVMVSYLGRQVPQVIRMRTEAAKTGDVEKNTTFTVRSGDAPKMEMKEFQVRFSDYRSVNGVQLPHRWTTSVGGQTTEVFDVASYEINPANLSDRFQHQKTFVRRKKDGN